MVFLHFGRVGDCHLVTKRVASQLNIGIGDTFVSLRGSKGCEVSGEPGNAVTDTRLVFAAPTMPR
jgi:hypothetical protein